jgi:hypothetical protein
MVDEGYLNDVGSVAGAVVGSTPAGLFGAAASVINNTVNNLFQSGVIHQQKKVLQLQQQLMVLDNQQQNNLAVQLAQTNDANEKLSILLGAVSHLEGTSVTANTKASSTWMLVAAGGVVLIIIVILIKQK